MSAPPSPEAREYMQRADEGLKRLNNLITRMGEARRLEQALKDGERSVYDVREVVLGCVEGYRAAYPAASFDVRATDAALKVDGSPDLLAQALDKLIANAVSFAVAGTPLIVSLATANGRVHLEVENSGPLLPPGPAARLFDSMVSERGEGAVSGEPHLGLGLYVARLAAQFHHGAVAARNRSDATGVVIEIDLPLAA